MTALFEHSPWVEARADARPSLGDRHADLMAVVREASDDERLALIRAHPELAEKAKLTDASAAEQASAGLDRLTELSGDDTSPRRAREPGRTFNVINTASPVALINGLMPSGNKWI